MERSITGAVGEVAARTVNTRTGPAPIWDVMIGTHKVSTFKEPVASEAKQLQGSTVEALCDVSEKNGYTNYTLLSLKVASATTASSLPLAPAISPESRGGYNDSRQESIVRQSSVKAAFHYAAALQFTETDAFDLAARIYQWCQNGGSEQQIEADLAVLGANKVNDRIAW